MPTPSIILEAGQVLITQSSSAIGLIPLNGNPTLFGAVVAVNDLSDKISVGDLVMYDSSKSVDFMYGSTIYTLVDEQYISGTETDVP